MDLGLSGVCCDRRRCVVRHGPGVRRLRSPARGATSRSSPGGRSCWTRRSPRSRALGTGAAALAVAGDSTDPADLRDARRPHARALRHASTSSSTTPAARRPASFEDFDDDGWRAAWDLTLMSTLRLTRLALPELRRSGRGRVVNITSSAVKEPNEGLLLSNVYRPGVIGWAKIAVAGRGPERHHRQLDRARLHRHRADEEPLRRRAPTRTATAAPRRGDRSRRGGSATRPRSATRCAFLCSTRAAYLNGITVLVDGGLAKGLLS